MRITEPASAEQAAAKPRMPGLQLLHVVSLAFNAAVFIKNVCMMNLNENIVHLMYEYSTIKFHSVDW